MIGQSSVIKFVVCGLFVFGIGVVFLNFFYYNRRQYDLVSRKKENAYFSLQTVDTVFSGIQADFESDVKPAKLTIANSKIDISKVSIRKYKIPANKDKVLFIVKKFAKNKLLFIFRMKRFLFEKVDKGIIMYFCFMVKNLLRKFGRILVKMMGKIDLINIIYFRYTSIFEYLGLSGMCY
jgi:hypothetical protein